MLTLSIESSNTDVVTVRLDATQPTMPILVTPQGAGTATITVTADDGNGGVTSDTFTISVNP